MIKKPEALVDSLDIRLYTSEGRKERATGKPQTSNMFNH